MGGEDFSFFMKEIPGVFFRLGIGDAEHIYPIHHNRFDINEEALLTGMKVFVQTVLDTMEGGMSSWKNSF